jgi:two-component system cell cycle sensor histidine kinase/response regulator CckA
VLISNDDFVGGINWEWLLDASQIFGLIFIIYLFLIYVPLVAYGEGFVSPIEDRLLLWRNSLLTAGLLARGLSSRSTDIRRLYLPMAAIIGILTISTWIANRAQEASTAPETAWYDLAWSIPFCLIALDASFWKDSPPGRIGAPLKLPSISRVILVFLPSLILPLMLLVKYRALLREQLFLGLFGLIFSIILFNVRLMLTQRRQRLTLEALRASEYQYRSLFERNMAGVFRSTLAGELVDCNPAFANMFGYSREELMGIPLHELYYGGREERSKWISSLQNDSRTAPRELCFRRKDGTTLWAVLNSNVDNQSPGTELLEGTLVDVTERRALEAQLRQAQKMEAMGRLAGGVAHDFNNLLTIICGYSAIQIERTNPSDLVHHEAEQIKAADRAAALTRQLLAFSRQQVLQPRPINLNDTVRSVDKMLRRLIGEDIEIITVLDPDLGRVEADPGQIDMVLMNLAVNSRDAMPQGGKLTIQTENVELDESYIQTHLHVVPGRYILLAVSDNGTGIAPETQARIFEPFFTTKEAGKGTGLGLPGVYGIVKQSGGSIEVYSELNHGTTIKIYLPRVDAIAEKVPLPAKRSSSKRGSERILLVEDDSLVRGLAVDVLKAQGYIVRAIERPEEVETILQESESFDLLLTDVVMPKMSGPEVAKRVASHWPKIKVLYISGHTRNVVAQHTLLEKDLSFLQKPFTPAVLTAKVREVLDAERTEN